MNKYVSTIYKKPFAFSKAKIIANMMLAKFDKWIIFNECIDNNKLEIISMRRRKEITRSLYYRLINIDKFLLKQFVNLDLISAKAILLYAVIKSDLLFCDFMNLIYYENKKNHKNYISKEDFAYFFSLKKSENVIIESWSEITFFNLTKAYKKFLIDANIAFRDKKKLIIKNIIVNPIIVDFLKANENKRYFECFLGG